jgi:hypothetical protein
MHPKVINTCMWLCCEAAASCTRCCDMSAALALSSCNQVCGRCAHCLSERAHASSPCLNIKYEPLETKKGVVAEPCKRWQRCPVGLKGKMEVLCWAMASPYFGVQEPLQTCTPCFHMATQEEHRYRTQNSAMSCLWVAHCRHVTCWKAPCVEAVGNFSSGPGHVVCAIAESQADETIIRGYSR